MNALYNTGLHLYSAAARLAALRPGKPRLMVRGQRRTLDTLHRLRRDIGDRPLVWVHAASLGEFEQGRPLIERLKRQRPDAAVLLSFFSPSGYEVRKNYALADAVVYLPFDTPRCARAFVEAARPDMAIFVKYEFWGNLLHELQERNVPTYLVSAIFRESQAFFKPWGGMFRRMLGCYDHIFVQNESSQRLLAGIGVTNVTVAGDTRFDRVTDTLRTASPVEAIERWTAAAPEEPVLVVGSSWPADEDVYLPMVASMPRQRVIIAPHEFDAQRLEALRRRIGPEHTMLYSEVQAAGGAIPDNVNCLIIDCFGLLSTIYRYATVAYIGGGFGAGIHNVPEAAVYGVPVVFGPKHQKFREAADLIACGGGFSVNSAEAFADVMKRLNYGDPSSVEIKSAGDAAGKYIADSLGASDIIADTLFPTLPSRHNDSPTDN